MDRKRLRDRIAQRPNAVRFEELEALLKAYGFELLRTRGSHHVYGRGDERIPVPYRRPHVLPVYVKEVLNYCIEDDDAEK